MTGSGCLAVNDNCATFNNDGECTSCFKGYEVSGGICVLSQVNTNPPTD